MQRAGSGMGRWAALGAAALLVFVAVLSSGGSSSSSRHTELAEEALYIVPQANVLTGAGQRPHKAAGTGGAGGASGGPHPDPGVAQHSASGGKAKKAAPPPKPAKKPWTPAQVQVQHQVAEEMARERKQREEKFMEQAKRRYQGVRKAAVAHEERRQSRLAGSLRRDRLRDLESESAIKSASSFKARELRGRESEVEAQTSQERAESDDANSDADHNEDLSWQAG